MGRTTLAVVLVASAACGLDVVGLEPALSETPAVGSDAGPTATIDGAMPPIVLAPDGGTRPGTDAGVDAGPTPTTSSLTLTHAALATSEKVNLTAMGTVDWVNWGQPKARKSTSAQAIMNLTTLGSQECTTYDFPCSLKWSDGTAMNAYDGHAGKCIFAPNQFYAFDVVASTKLRTLTLLLGAYQSQGKLTVTLSDGTPAQTDNSLNNTTESMATIAYTVTFKAAAATGTTLHVDWRDESSRPQGSVYLGTAALRE